LRKGGVKAVFKFFKDLYIERLMFEGKSDHKIKKRPVKVSVLDLT
jgi:hypothetical protein